MNMNGNDNRQEAESAQMAIDPRLDALIGAKLRSYYDTLLSEPVPDRILELLMQLDAKESGTTENDEGQGSR